MLTYGFFDSSNGDRKYTSTQMSEIFDGIIEDGVYSNVGEALAVVPGTGLQVIVKTGRAWFKHTWTLNNTYMPLNIENPDPYRSRIDAVILEVNHNLDVRANSITILKGPASTSATKPTLLHENGIDQYALAYVTVDPGVNEIAASKIEIAVGKNETPFVQCPLRTVSIEDLFNQWQGEFDEWFDNVKATLTNNVVTNLQRQIDERVKVADKATANDVKFGTPNKWLDPTVFTNGVYYNTAPVGAVIRDPGVDLARLYPTKYRELDGGIIENPPAAIKEKYFMLPEANQTYAWGCFTTPYQCSSFGYNMTWKQEEMFVDRVNYTISWIYHRVSVGSEYYGKMFGPAAAHKPPGDGSMVLVVVYADAMIYVTSNGNLVIYRYGDVSTFRVINLKTAVSGITFTFSLDVKIIDFAYDNNYAHILIWDYANNRLAIWYSNDYFQTIAAKVFPLDSGLTSNRIIPFVLNTGTIGGLNGLESVQSSRKIHQYKLGPNTNRWAFMLPSKNNSATHYEIDTYELTLAGPLSNMAKILSFNATTLGINMTALRNAYVFAYDHFFHIVFRDCPVTFSYQGNSTVRRMAWLHIQLDTRKQFSGHSIPSAVISPDMYYKQYIIDINGYCCIVKMGENDYNIFSERVLTIIPTNVTQNQQTGYFSPPHCMARISTGLTTVIDKVIEGPLNIGQLSGGNSNGCHISSLDGYICVATSGASNDEVMHWATAGRLPQSPSAHTNITNNASTKSSWSISILDTKRGLFDASDIIQISSPGDSPNIFCTRLTENVAYAYTTATIAFVNRQKLRLPKEPGTYIAIS